MCGIYCSLLKVDSVHSCNCSSPIAPTALKSNHNQLLTNRGPDVSGYLTVELGDWNARFEAHVLWLQGDKPQEQPIRDENKNILLWNGDAFNSHELSDVKSECDTSIIAKALSQAGSTENSEDAILKFFSKIEGPWSFIYWHARHRQLWFGRDAMGRHSLLWSQPNEAEGLIVTSVTSRQELPTCKELPATGIFVASLKDSNLSIKLYPWNTSCVENLEAIHSHSPTDYPKNLELCQNTKLSSPYPPCNLEVPQENDKFLLTVNSLIASPTLTSADILSLLLQDEDTSERVNKLSDALTASVDVRCKTQPQLCKQCVPEINVKDRLPEKCGHSKVAVLFSGGLDSAVLAVLADRCVSANEPIDLINVAFQSEKSANIANNRKERRKKYPVAISTKDLKQCGEDEEICLKTNIQFDVPDRLSGKKTYHELLLARPNRIWNFVEVNVTKAELEEQRQERIADLIHPRCSVLDDSLGCALWFAARGIGTMHQPDGTTLTNYTSPARVLLLGMGADELLGGYSRHRKLLSRSQDWSQLAQSLNHDIIAIPARNLARDDRVTQDSGRQARFPYLAEGVLQLLASLPAHLRTVPLPGLPVGVGEKVLLRLLAARMGLAFAAQAPKRAMQFGSRVAGLEARNEKGDDPCSRLLLPQPL